MLRRDCMIFIPLEFLILLQPRLTLSWTFLVLFFSIYLPFHPGISRLPPICSPVRSVPGRGISNDVTPKLQPGSSPLAAGSLPLAAGNSPMTATGSPRLAATNTEKDPRHSWQINIPPSPLFFYNIEILSINIISF